MIDFYSVFLEYALRAGMVLGGILFSLEFSAQFESQLDLKRLKEAGRKILAAKDPLSAREMTQESIHLISRRFPIEAFVRQGVSGRNAVVRFFIGLRAERTGIETHRAR